jgi:hypothetical protein
LPLDAAHRGQVIPEPDVLEQQISWAHVQTIRGHLLAIQPDRLG